MNTSNRRKNQRKRRMLPKEKFACTNLGARGLLARLATAQIIVDSLPNLLIYAPVPTFPNILTLALAELDL
jgi:hypothetical protein